MNPPRSDLYTRSPTELTWPDDRPELLPFLPLVYVAWSDGVLTDAELEALCLPIEAQLWIDQADLRELRAWLRPEQPPSPASLARLKARIRELAPDPGAERPDSLVDLGLILARNAGGADGHGPWARPAARAGLRTVEAALGVVPREAVRSLLGAPPSAPEPSPPGRSSPFSVDAARSFLDQPYPEIRERVRELLVQPQLRMPLEIEREAYRTRVLGALRRLSDEGLGGLAFPEEFGGEGSPGRALAAFETLALGDLSVLVKYGVQFGLFGGSILQLGTGRHHEAYLRRVALVELPGGYAMTEVGHGSNVRAVETTARYDAEAGEFVVDTPTDSARKDWIGNAARDGRMVTVFAQLEVDGEEHGVHAFLVPIRHEDGQVCEGVEIEDCGPKAGLDGVDNGRLRFDRVRIPRENLLDRFGTVSEDGRYHSPIPSPGRRFFTMLGTLVAGRISVASASVSAAKTGLTIAVRYSARRRQFGPADGPEVPLLDYLAHQRLLLPRLATTYGLHFAVRDLARRYERCQSGDEDELDSREVEALAAGFKAYASTHCVGTLQACREAMGGRGYLAANRLGRLKADTDVFTTFEGANVVLLQLVAKSLLGEYREEMGDLRIWGIARYLADRAQEQLTELNPVATRRTDSDHLRDPDFHATAFRYRARRLLRSAARRLKTLIDDGTDSFEAMNRCQDHLVTLAEAHVESEVLGSFHDAVKRAPTPGLSELLRTTAALYALERLEQHRGWYLESGYVEGSKARAIRTEVNRLCRELEEHALFLVDAFGIPEPVLSAPAGRRPVT